MFRETEHFFLDLPAFAEQLLGLDQRAGALAAERAHFSLELAGGGCSRARSRATSTGACRSRCRVRGREDKRIYVWFEAVIGYLSASVEWAQQQRRRPTPGATGGRTRAARHYYFIGKDNIVFHSVIWPSMLLGYGDGGEIGGDRGSPSTCPTTWSRSEFLTMEGKKFSRAAAVGSTSTTS